MLKRVFVESVALKINGGSFNPEAAVPYEDIYAFLPLAVNYAVTAGRNTNIKEDGTRDYPSCFYGSFTGLAIDRTGRIPTITFPKGYIPLPSNQGIRFISDNCGNYYAPLTDNDRSMAKDYTRLLPDERFYYPIGTLLELYNAPVLAETLNGDIIVRAEDLEDTDELPIQAGLETVAIQVCYEWLTGQRQMPAQMKSANNDVNTVP